MGDASASRADGVHVGIAEKVGVCQDSAARQQTKIIQCLCIVFAAALLKVLRENDRILTQTGLERALSDPVRTVARRIGVEQTPELKKVREAGDAGGAFFLVPRTASSGG